jgi:hypothetical protein
VRPLNADAYCREATYRATRLPVSHASTLIPDAYAEPASRELELDRTSSTTWVQVAVADAVAQAGDALVAPSGGFNREDIAIAERVQRGLAPPAYTGGRMRSEQPMFGT